MAPINSFLILSFAILWSEGPLASADRAFLCGERHSRKISKRSVQGKIGHIVGGKNARMGDFPWIVSVQDKSRGHVCGGSIIDHQWILSAAHCYVQLTPDQVEVKVGDVNHNRGQKHKVVEIINHEKFAMEHYQADVALLKIEPPIKWSHGRKFGRGAIVPICLPSKNSEFTGTATVAGWGLTDPEGEKASTSLQAVDVNIFDCSSRNCHCVDSYDIFDPEVMLCAGKSQGGQDSCQGDSGGPLMGISDNDRVVQIGAVSYGEGCAEKERPGVYVKLSRFIDWIKDKSGLEKLPEISDESVD